VNPFRRQSGKGHVLTTATAGGTIVAVHDARIALDREFHAKRRAWKGSEVNRQAAAASELTADHDGVATACNGKQKSNGGCPRAQKMGNASHDFEDDEAAWLQTH
jgi:hypothetical protein